MKRFLNLLIAVGLPCLGIRAGAAEEKPAAPALSYTIVDTGQTQCYSDHAQLLTVPKPGEPFYGQDGFYRGPQPGYRNNGDGTISDLNTGLIWVQARGSKISWDDAVAGAADCRVGKHEDWRMPTIKELYSLINFTGGYDFQGGAARSKPYLDTNYFGFIYGDESKGERGIDCQDWSATTYVSTTMNNNPTAFGVNFADGRIKGYPKITRGPLGTKPLKLFVRYVRGNPAYGKNEFHDNGDGTVSDRATGLMWAKADSGKGLNWEQALAYANGLKLAGHADWRLPNAKELQSLVDYTRSPATTQSPAIDPIFQTSQLADGEFPFFWTSTTHLDGPAERRGTAAVYVAFGRATGWMLPRGAGGTSPMGGPGPDRQRGPGKPGQAGGLGGAGQPASAGAGNYQLQDVHGAGAQRSDPKTGNPADYPHGRGPQGDVIRIFNHVRVVRNIDPAAVQLVQPDTTPLPGASTRLGR